MQNIKLQPKAQFLNTSHRFKHAGVQRTVVLKEVPNYEDLELYRMFAAAGGTVYFENGAEFTSERPKIAVYRGEIAAAEPKKQTPEPKTANDETSENAAFVAEFAKMPRAEFGLPAKVSNADIKKLAKILGAPNAKRDELYQLVLKFVR